MEVYLVQYMHEHKGFYSFQTVYVAGSLEKARQLVLNDIRDYPDTQVTWKGTNAEGDVICSIQIDERHVIAVISREHVQV